MQTQQGLLHQRGFSFPPMHPFCCPVSPQKGPEGLSAFPGVFSKVVGIIRSVFIHTPPAPCPASAFPEQWMALQGPHPGWGRKPGEMHRLHGRTMSWQWHRGSSQAQLPLQGWGPCGQCPPGHAQLIRSPAPPCSRVLQPHLFWGDVPQMTFPPRVFLEETEEGKEATPGDGGAEGGCFVPPQVRQMEASELGWAGAGRLSLNFIL